MNLEIFPYALLYGVTIVRNRKLQRALSSSFPTLTSTPYVLPSPQAKATTPSADICRASNLCNETFQHLAAGALHYAKAP
jgi:hypothetical protein